jgi:hypothetical protein
MDYNHITSFFDRVKKILSEGEGANILIAEIITKQICFPVDTKMIKTKGGYIYVQGSPMLRNEILIHKEEILKEISESIPGRHFKDIK